MNRRILFDGYWLSDGPPSGRNVVIGLINGWARAHPADTVNVAVQPSFDGSQLAPTVVPLVKASRIRNHGAWILTRFGSLSGGFDAVISQNFTPVGVSDGSRVATFFHDAIFRTNPEWFTVPERSYLRVASSTLRYADVVLTSSAAESERIRATHPRLRAPVHSIGLALPESFNRTDQDPHSPTSARKFILSVGRLNVRKNVSSLIEAFQAANLPEHDLLVVGAADGKPTGAEATPNVTFAGAVDDQTLADLYATCDFFVFPSLDEGFGLPLLEAAHFGAPTAASDIPAFREVGTAAVYFDPRRLDSIVDALHRMARQHPRETKMHEGREQRYSWLESARSARRAIFPETVSAS